MKTRISHLRFAALFSVAVITDVHVQGTVFPDQGRRKDEIAVAHGAAEPGPLTGDKAIAHLKSTGQYASLSAAITGARYGVKTDPQREQHAAAANPAHGLLSTFTPEGVRLQIRTGGEADAPVHTVTWRLESLGYGAAQIPVGAGKMKISGQRIELIRGESQNPPVLRSPSSVAVLRRVDSTPEGGQSAIRPSSVAALRRADNPQLVEWFQNTPAGLEHGFTLAERPSANPQSEPLRLVMAATGDLAPQADATGQNLRLRDAAGRAVVSYEKLKVWDASGTELPATMQTGTGCVILSVKEAAARYPLTIDPTFAQQAYLKPNNTGASDQFGSTVAVSGDTVVVGAVTEDSNDTGINGTCGNNTATNSGAAYVFVRSGTNWSLQAYLKASNAGEFDFFGQSVAVAGDTVVVGAFGEDSNATGVNGDGSNNSPNSSGAAYVFVRSGTNWSQQAYLKASNTGAGDRFGQSVAVAGDTVVVGAPDEESNATGINGTGGNNSADAAGAAYVFVRVGTNWSQQAYLKASNTGEGDFFGASVAVAGETVVVGAPFEDSSATGVNGNGGDNSATNSGAAYVFVRSGTNWSQQAYLKASNTGADDGFGSVAVAGDTVVVGASGEDSNATGVNGNSVDNSATNSGAVYVFVRNSLTGVWGQRSYLKASNTGAGDGFGSDVAVSGGMVVVGAPFEASNATGVNGNQSDNSASLSGAAYVFVRGGSIANPTWSYRDYLKASNTEGADLFGSSVAVSGGTVVVGASLEDGNATGVNGNQSDNSLPNAGATYVFQATVPEIAVEQPLNTNIADGGSQDFVAIGGNNPSLTFTVKNIGNDTLTGLTITTDGPDAAMFTVAVNPTAPVAPGGNTTFIVRFAPTSPGAKTAALHLASNDLDENPFDIVLQGFTLTFTQDTDGDGINDASEFQMSNLGFDWKVSQPALVNTLSSNANGIGLFTPSQVQALNVDAPLISKDPVTGLIKLTIGVQKSTDLIRFDPFPMSAPQTMINGQGKLEFQFSAPDNAAFFRLEAR